MSDDPRYPIGRFQKKDALSADERARALAVLDELPALVRGAVEGLDDTQLDTPYREGGWTLRQVVHHLADSHLNAYVRARWALTEDAPTIKAYDEKRWSELPDARSAPLAPSLALLEGVHARFTGLLRSLDEGQLARRFIHPEGWTGTIDTLIALYAWHGRHHVGHLTGLRERMGW